LRHQRLLISILFLLTSFTFTISIFGQSSFRELSLNVTVTDDNGGVAVGLKREWFSVVEQKSQLQVTGLEASDEPASVIVAVDFSGSIPGYLKEDFIQVVSRFMRTANPRNEYLILGFATDVTVITDWGRDLAAIKNGLSAAQRQTKDGTLLYDACSEALKRFGAGRYPLHVLLVLSDGQDNNSKLNFTKLREQLRQSSAILYALDATRRFDPSEPLALEGKGILDELAFITGGNAYYPASGKELLAAVDQISLELSHQYRISFKPALVAPDDKWHPVKIKLTLPERDDKGRKFTHVNIRSRQGYYDH
jgi:VWFA-related protein